VTDGPDLQDHHAHGVCDDVVQLAGDARTLLGDRDAGPRFALELRLSRTPLGGFGLLRAFAQREADKPRDRDQERREDELACGMRWIVVDHDGGAADDDCEAEPRLEVVGKLSEQQRRGEPGRERPAVEDDKPAVCERDCGPQEPDERRSRERKAAPREQRQNNERGRGSCKP
jgi:hypothetical protein